MRVIKINAQDNVAVILQPVVSGEIIQIDNVTIKVQETIDKGHKIAIRKIANQEKIIKYGYPIGHAVQDIEPGFKVHVHNMKTDLSEKTEYSYNPENISEFKELDETVNFDSTLDSYFYGFKRRDGKVAVRNELWIIPTVGCVNSVAQKLANDNQKLVAGSLEGIYTFTHPFGCSQMGEDHLMTQKVLAAMTQHPNAAGVLIVGLGCENNTMDQFKQVIKAKNPSFDPNRIRYLVCQEVEDEYSAGSEMLGELAEIAKQYSREQVPVSELIIGMKCGGSDGLSGITANPAVGIFSDLLISKGGSTILTEVPEMFGAEGMLMNRCISEQVYTKLVKTLDDFKKYFVDHGQVVYENPSPGNKDGGISTLEDKSCGCVQKSGNAPVVDVIDYADTLKKPGLNLLSGPGNDLVSTTALTAAGAHIILFTTGRGTPFGAPAPTVKISSNTELYEKKSGWIDFDTGTVASGKETILDAGDRLYEYVLKVASGEQTKTEENGFREISIFKDGVTL